MKNLKNILKNAVILSMFSTLCILMTVLVYYLTKNKIIHYEKIEKNIFLKKIVSKKIYTNYQKKCYLVEDNRLGDHKLHNLWLFLEYNRIMAAVVESVAPDGYAGPIHLLVAADLDGKIIGVQVLSHKETPGIGDKIELSISDWITQFKNMYVLNITDKNVLLKKYGGKIEQFTGATITPQAVTNAVKKTVLFIKSISLKNMLKDCS